MSRGDFQLRMGLTPSDVVIEYGDSQCTPNCAGRIKSVELLDSAQTAIYREVYEYDDLSVVTSVKKCMSVQICANEDYEDWYVIEYGHNLAGRPTRLVYPSGRVIRYEYDQIGRPADMVDSDGVSLSTAFVSDNVSNPVRFINTVSYSAAGQLDDFVYGNAVSANLNYYPNSLQLDELQYTSSGILDFRLKYHYTHANGGNNGQISSIDDLADPNRDMRYTYDSLGRLTDAEAGDSANPQWGLSWSYDRYGNRTAQNATSGSPPVMSTPVSAATNRLSDSAFTYDANGNLKSDGTYTYT